MSRNINVTLVGYQATGSNVNFPQYEASIGIEWIDNAGSSQSASQLVRFPNILSASELSNQWLEDRLKRLMLDALREISGVDN